VTEPYMVASRMWPDHDIVLGSKGWLGPTLRKLAQPSRTNQRLLVVRVESGAIFPIPLRGLVWFYPSDFRLVQAGCS
jgi:hypothetical protein